MNRTDIRQRRIQVLHDYMMRHMATLAPDRICALVRDIGAAFPENSHTFFLAELVEQQINRLWNQGHLDRVTLATLALLMVFERYVPTVNLKRTFIDAVRFGRMRVIIPPPVNLLRARA